MAKAGEATISRQQKARLTRKFIREMFAHLRFVKQLGNWQHSIPDMVKF